MSWECCFVVKASGVNSIRFISNLDTIWMLNAFQCQVNGKWTALIQCLSSLNDHSNTYTTTLSHIQTKSASINGNAGFNVFPKDTLACGVKEPAIELLTDAQWAIRSTSGATAAHRCKCWRLGDILTSCRVIL